MCGKKGDYSLLLGDRKKKGREYRRQEMRKQSQHITTRLNMPFEEKGLPGLGLGCLFI